MTSTDDSRTETPLRLGQLVSTLSEKLSALIRAEIELAKAEMAEKARNAAIGIGLFFGALLLGYFGVAVLLAAIVLGLAEALPAWLSALIVAVLLLGLAALLIFFGKRSLDRGKPVPEHTQASVKADVATVKAGLNRGGAK